MTSRFIFDSEVPDDERPTFSAFVCRPGEVADRITELGGDFPDYGPAERNAERAARKQHLQRRYPA